MYAYHSLPGSKNFRVVELADNKRATLDAADAWRKHCHTKMGCTGMVQGNFMGAGAKTRWKYQDGTRIISGNEPILFAPGTPEPELLAGWERVEGPGYVVHRIKY
jgi:hypothetical protein